MIHLQRDAKGAIAARAVRVPARIDLDPADWRRQDPRETEDRDSDRLDIASLLMAAALAALVLLPTFGTAAQQMLLH